ncbi:uncharacterized protein PAC_01928 [Phialocephala subalpina]|uniref:Uncharacterized protein n=1 Tax=Phialocephala subalpina TaxID=576137 RepID=A0A1L7WGY6_9HELO|nr:uncharacterized protein PAC_01928 [Phialocephala subalpina]
MLKMPTPASTSEEKNYDSFEEFSCDSSEEDDVRSLNSDGSEQDAPDKANDATPANQVPSNANASPEADKPKHYLMDIVACLSKLDMSFRALRKTISSDKKVQSEIKTGIHELVKRNPALFGDEIKTLAEENFTLRRKAENLEAVQRASRAQNQCLKHENKTLKETNGIERRNTKQDINSLKALLDVEKDKLDAGHEKHVESLRQAEGELDLLERTKTAENEQIKTEAKAKSNKLQSKLAEQNNIWVNIYHNLVSLMDDVVSVTGESSKVLVDGLEEDLQKVAVEKHDREIALNQAKCDLQQVTGILKQKESKLRNIKNENRALSEEIRKLERRLSIISRQRDVAGPSRTQQGIDSKAGSAKIASPENRPLSDFTSELLPVPAPSAARPSKSNEYDEKLCFEALIEGPPAWFPGTAPWRSGLDGDNDYLSTIDRKTIHRQVKSMNKAFKARNEANDKERSQLQMRLGEACRDRDSSKDKLKVIVKELETTKKELDGARKGRDELKTKLQQADKKFLDAPEHLKRVFAGKALLDDLSTLKQQRDEARKELQEKAEGRQIEINKLRYEKEHFRRRLNSLEMNCVCETVVPELKEEVVRAKLEAVTAAAKAVKDYERKPIEVED